MLLLHSVAHAMFTQALVKHLNGLVAEFTFSFCIEKGTIVYSTNTKIKRKCFSLELAKTAHVSLHQRHCADVCAQH